MNSFNADRRDFLKTVGGAGAMLAALPTAQADEGGREVELQAAKVGATVRFALQIDGKEIGYLSSGSGGNAVGDVVSEKLGPDNLVKKHIANVKYEDLTVAFATGLSKTVYEWVADTINLKPRRHDGAVIGTDSKFQTANRLEFKNALLAEIAFPALDASSKEAVRMTIKFAPESTRRIPGDGGGVLSPPNSKAIKQWLSSNFKLEIDGLDCSKVNKIEALTIKQKVTENAVGDARDFEKAPANLDFPNLVISLTEASAKSFYDWHEDFVIKGNNSADREKKGTLYWLTTDLKFQIASLNFSGLGIFKLTPDPWDANSGAIRRVKAEMYCERMEFKFFATS